MRLRSFVAPFLVLLAVASFGMWLQGAVPDVPTGTWLPGPALAQPRAGAVSATLADDSVLVIGGRTPEGPVRTVDVYGADGVLRAGRPLAVARAGHTAAVLPDGSVLVIGGTTTVIGEDGATREAPTSSAELYVGGVWTTVGSLSFARSGHTATALADGRVLVAGGTGEMGALDSMEVYDPEDGTFSFLTVLPNPVSEQAAAVAGENQVLIVGGRSGGGVLASASLVNVDTASVVPVTLGTPRAAASATTLLNGHRILITGGYTIEPNAEGVSVERDLVSTEIVNVAVMPATVSAGASMAQPRRNPQALLLPYNATVLVTGGTNNGAVVPGADQYVPWARAFNPTGSPTIPRAGGSLAGLKKEGIALLAGGAVESELYGFATITTDKDDYSPGMVVYVSGSGWQPGETVTFKLREVAASDDTSPTACTLRTFSIVADDAGRITNAKLFDVEEHHLGVRFYLTAIGAASQAQVTFTDGNVNVRTVGSSTAATITWVRYGTGDCTGAPNASGSISAVTNGNGTSVPGGAAQGQSLLFTALPVTGRSFLTWTGDVPTDPDSANPICVPGRNSTRQIQANFGAAKTTSLTVAAASGPYGGNTVLSATLAADSPAAGVPGKVVTFSLNGVPACGGSTGVSCPTTNAAGVANLSDVSLAGIDAGMYSTAIGAVFAGDADYLTSSGNGLLIVNKVSPVITWTDPAAVTYGTLLGSTQLNASATVPGTFSYTPASGDLLGAGVHALSVLFTPTDTTNYNAASTTVSISVLKATPLIAWSNPADIVYGTLLGAPQLNATADVVGAFAYTPAAGTKLSAGSGHTLMATFTPTDTANYNNASKTVAINVLKATPVITWTNPADIVYGTLLSDTQLNAVADVPGTFVYAPAAGTKLSAGAGQTLTAIFTPTDAANYNDASKTVSINVLKATPVITWADPVHIVYGTLLSATELNATADVPGTFVYTPAAGTRLDAGDGQTLTANFTPTDTANYNDASKAVSLDVLRRPASVTPTGSDKTYGDPDPVLSGGLQGFLPADNVTAVYSRNPGETAGLYTITAVLSPQAVLGNYEITQNTAPFVIHKRSLTVTAQSFTITLGASTPPFDVDYSGFVFEESAETALLGTPEFTFTGIAPTSYESSNIAPTEPGVYRIEVSGLTSENYALNYVPGKFNIQFAWSGYLQPINDTAHQIGQTLSKFKLGQTIPAKFVLRDANGNIVQQMGNPTFGRTNVLGACGGSLQAETVEAVAADTTPVYRWDGTQYHYNWSTKNLTTGLYRIFANLADGTQQYVDICLTK